jgi:hypothetical protein
MGEIHGDLRAGEAQMSLGMGAEYMCNGCAMQVARQAQNACMEITTMFPPFVASPLLTIERIALVDA